MDATLRRDLRAIPVRRVRARAGEASAIAERITIGSASDCDLVLEDRTVSRYHAEVAGDGAGIRVRDLGSTNGVTIGGVRAIEVVVPAGTTLELGGVRVIVEDASLALEELGSEGAAGIVARSAASRRLLERVRKAAAVASPVLVSGEPGSGKELVARTVHALSARAPEPIVIVECGALIPSLAQSELFGHERGAFTDAEQRRIGAFERAGRGTIVLDEVAELPLELQPVLLGALERRRIRRVGGSEDLTLEARVIACTTRDLRREVNEARFRLDLYYRLAVVKIEVPPLRERLEDLGELIGAILDEHEAPAAHPLRGEDALEALAARAYPGNVRELRNVIESALALDDLAIEHEAVATSMEHPSTDGLIEALLEQPYKDARARIGASLERAYATELARRAQGNISLAARLAGLDRSQLRQILRRAGVTIAREPDQGTNRRSGARRRM